MKAGMMELDDLEKLPAALNVDIEERLANPMDEVVEDTIVRQFGIVASEDRSPSMAKR